MKYTRFPYENGLTSNNPRESYLALRFGLLPFDKYLLGKNFSRRGALFKCEANK